MLSCIAYDGVGTTAAAHGADNSIDSIRTRHSLLNRLKDWGDQASWQDFLDTYWRLIYNVAVKAGLADTEAEEVVQETVIAVAKKNAEFKADCPPELAESSARSESRDVSSLQIVPSIFAPVWLRWGCHEPRRATASGQTVRRFIRGG